MQTVHTGKDSINHFSQDAWTFEDLRAGPQACTLEPTEPDLIRLYELAAIWDLWGPPLETHCIEALGTTTRRNQRKEAIILGCGWSF